MKSVASLLLALAACGGQPLLANAPHPPAGAAAGVAAAAAAAITLASPTTATQRPEQKINDNTNGQTVKENVPPAVFDRLDAQQAAGSANPAPTAAPAPTHKGKGPAPRLPSPKDAVDQTQPQPADAP